MPGENSNQPDTATTTAATTAATASTATSSATTDAAKTATTATAAATTDAAKTATSVLTTEPPKTNDASKATTATVGAPEKYEFKVADGAPPLDPALLEAFTPVFKELGLTQEQAQKLVDANNGVAPKLAEAMQKQVQEEIVKQNAEWVKSCREDKEYGGVEYDKSVKLANQAYAQFASPALIQTLAETGYGSHPEFVRLFVNIGKKLAESTPPTTAATGSQATTASVLYPSMKTN